MSKFPFSEDSGLCRLKASGTAAVLCNFRWLETYLASEHFHFVRILHEQHGFDIIDSVRTDFTSQKVIEEINFYELILFAYQGHAQIPAERFTPYKIFKIDDLEAYNASHTEFMKSLARNSQMLIGPYAYDMHRFFAHPNIVWVPYSSAVEEECQTVPFNPDPVRKVLASGSVAWDRPFRQFVLGLNDERIAKLHHPGYGGRYDQTSIEIVKAKWYRELNKYLAVFCDGHSLRYIHLRVFEAASVGALLLADRLVEHEMGELGFIDGRTCVFCDQQDFLDKVAWTLDPVNRQTVDEIRGAGMHLALERHTTKERVASFVQMVKDAQSRPIASAIYADCRLQDWQVAHEMTTKMRSGELAVSDSTQLSYHLLRIYSSDYLYRKIRLKCRLRRSSSNRTNFYVHHFGNVDVCEVDLEGRIVNRGTTTKLLASVDREIMEVEAEFICCHTTLSIGTSHNGHPIYAGDGSEQFTILQIQVYVLDASKELSSVPKYERIVLVDVGAQEGLQLKWMLQAENITPILFEPIKLEAEKLRATINRIPGAVVVDAALGQTAGPKTLHVTSASGCSSLLPPNKEIIERYRIAGIFQVVDLMEIECIRYDELFMRGAVPAPDVIKIDVQGYEYEVLSGFGRLLDNVLGIELEAHFYPLYSSQKLLGDIVNLLDGHALVLRRVETVPNFDGDLVEVNAFFTKRREAVKAFSIPAKSKFERLTRVWQLAAYD